MAGVEKAGAVYRCQTDPPHHCEQIPFDTSGKLLLNLLCIRRLAKYYDLNMENIRNDYTPVRVIYI